MTRPAPGDGGWPERLETVVGGLLIALTTTPGMLLLGVSEDPNAPENPAFRLWWPPIYATTLLLCAVRWKSLARAWAPALLCGVLVAWAFASGAWSILPEVTQRRGLALAMTTLFGLYLGAAWAPLRLVRVLAATFTGLAVLSAVVALAAPRLGVEHEAGLVGDWRGLWSTKNALAEFMTIGALAALAAMAGSRRRWPWLLCTAACVAMLLASRGKTSLLCLILAMAAAGALHAARRGPVIATVSAFVAASVVLWGGFLAWARPDILLQALGKEPTLTGRTSIWSSVLMQARQHPWLGFGFGAFWERASVPAQIVHKQTKWPVPSAHNGWLDLMLQVGGVGVVLFGAVLAVTLAAASWRVFRLKDGFFAPMFLILFLVISLSESVLLQHNNLGWALFVAVVAMALRPAEPEVVAAAPSDPAPVERLPWPDAAGRREPGLFEV